MAVNMMMRMCGRVCMCMCVCIDGLIAEMRTEVIPAGVSSHSPLLD